MKKRLIAVLFTAMAIYSSYANDGEKKKTNHNFKKREFKWLAKQNITEEVYLSLDENEKEVVAQCLKMRKTGNLMIIGGVAFTPIGFASSVGLIFNFGPATGLIPGGIIHKRRSKQILEKLIEE